MSESRGQNRIQPVDLDNATGEIKRLFTEVRERFGLVPNLFRVLANAPAALQVYVNFSATLAAGPSMPRCRS